MSIIIAIDGPAASGKGTLARRLAEHLDFAYLEVGLILRAIGVATKQSGGDPTNQEHLLYTANTINYASITDRPELRTDEAASYATRCGRITEIQTIIIKRTRDFAENPPNEKRGVVVDGRGIATEALPHAQVKLYLTASAEVRALRRTEDLRTRGLPACYETVLENLRTCDHHDMMRPTLTLKPAKESVILNTSRLTAEQTFAAALHIIATQTSPHRMVRQRSHHHPKP